MTPGQSLRLAYTFAGFKLDGGTRCLSREGEPVPLSPKEFEALMLLVEAGGHAIPRETLIQSLWPHTAVGDTSLGRVISVLRRHLGAESIVSVARFGYRFTPVVSVYEPPPSTPDVPQPVAAASVSRPRVFRRSVAGAAVAILLLTCVGGLTARARHQKSLSLAESEAVRWDTLGLFALREGTYFKASRAFEQAVRLAPDSSLLHAHLADALLQLNMDEDARQQLLLAADHSSMQRLSEPDQRYVEAVRATAVRDYAGATRQYETILAASDAQDRSGALEDLARALQREGRLPEAIAAYRRAAELQPSNAGVQLRLGLLAGLQRDWAGADSYLERATLLFEASTNEEGKAEVAYQRASMAYVRADYTRAISWYRESLSLAEKLNDLQMEARALGGLSTVLRWQGDLPGSADAANRVMTLARVLHSDFWRVEGIMHLANLAIVRRDVAESRALLTEALELATRIQQPRLQANAEYSMADLADLTGDFAQELTFARLARQHYGAYGSADGVADASMQIIQAERGLHDYPSALRDAQTLLQDSTRTGSDLFAEDTEAELGHIYTDLQDYPVALDHYKRALQLAVKTQSQVSLKSLHVVSALLNLGRRQEALKLFSRVPSSVQSDPDCEKAYQEVQLLLRKSKSQGSGPNT